MIWLTILPILFFYSFCNDVSEEKSEYDDIQEVIFNISKIYENPKSSTHRNLLETGILYLDKLHFLQDEVKAGIPKAERLIRKLHKEGAYDQVDNVPFSILIGHYGWNSMEVAEYENIVERTKEIWNYFMDEINYGSFGIETTTRELPQELMGITDDPDYPD